ncbi:hypothetical protein quinque_009849 [Culex quinquefasciatus]
MITKKPYITCNWKDEAITNDIERILENEAAELEVPCWTVIDDNNDSASNSSELLTENISDEVYMKRHAKFELDERRRKKWDVQRIREQKTIERWKKRHLKTDPDSEQKNIVSFYPLNNLLGYFIKGRFHKFESSEVQRRARSYDIDYYQVEYTEKFPLQEEESAEDSSGGYYYYLITLSFAAVSFYMGASSASNSSNPFQWNFQPSWVGGSLGASLGALTPAGIAASFTFLTTTMRMPGMVAGIVILTISAGYGYLCAASTGKDWNYRNWNMTDPGMRNALFGGTRFGSAFWAGIGSVETSFYGASGAARIIFIIVVISGTLGTAFYATAVSRGNVRFWEWNWRDPEVAWKTAYGATFGLGMAIPVYSLGALWPQFLEEIKETDKTAQLYGDQYVWTDKNNTKNPNATTAQMYTLVETIFISGALFEATEIHPLLDYLPSSASTTLPLLDGFVHKIYNHFENLLNTPPTTNSTQELAFPKTNQKPHYLLPNCYHHSPQPNQPPITSCTGHNFQYTIHPKSGGALTEDRYSYCSPIEFGGKPSVVCEGESSTLIFTPKITTPLLDHLDGVMMLALVAPAVLRNVRSLVGLCCGMFSGKVQEEVPPDARDVLLEQEQETRDKNKGKQEAREARKQESKEARRSKGTKEQGARSKEQESKETKEQRSKGTREQGNKSKGRQGEQGSKGTGNKGARETKGAREQKGTREQGRQGEQGNKGARGDKGNKEQRNKGTREQRETKEQGSKGDKGAREQGNKGSKGRQGAREQGRQGTKGAKGDKGTKGTREQGDKEQGAAGRQGNKETKE